MIRILIPLAVLAACAEFPLLDAAAPAEPPPRPAYLSPDVLAQLNAPQSETGPIEDTPAAAALRDMAQQLRGKTP